MEEQRAFFAPPVVSRIAMITVHTSPLALPGSGEAGGSAVGPKEVPSHGRPQGQLELGVGAGLVLGLGLLLGLGGAHCGSGFPRSASFWKNSMI